MKNSEKVLLGWMNVDNHILENAKQVWFDKPVAMSYGCYNTNIKLHIHTDDIMYTDDVVYRYDRWYAGNFGIDGTVTVSTSDIDAAKASLLTFINTELDIPTDADELDIYSLSRIDAKRGFCVGVFKDHPLVYGYLLVNLRLQAVEPIKYITAGALTGFTLDQIKIRS